jgi:4-hydroxy-tetrahydrodipicolinate synthase
MGDQLKINGESLMYQGSMVAVVTPMGDDGSVDKDALSGLVEFHIAQGTNAIVAVGTTGESATLSHDEHCEVIRDVVGMVNKRVPVIAGTGANSTSEAIALTRCAADAGADACLLVTPYYNKPTQEGLYQHYCAVAEAVAIDQILYNVPGRTACDMQAETVIRLSTVKNIVGIKEATGDIERIRDLVKGTGDDFAVLSGEDWLSCETMIEGGVGVISVTANVAPKLMRAMCDASLRGDATEGRRLDAMLQPLHAALFLESNPIPVKWAVHQLGLMGPTLRLPMTPLSAVHYDAVRQAMIAADVSAGGVTGIAANA